MNYIAYLEAIIGYLKVKSTYNSLVISSSQIFPKSSKQGQLALCALVSSFKAHTDCINSLYLVCLKVNNRWYGQMNTKSYACKVTLANFVSHYSISFRIKKWNHIQYNANLVLQNIYPCCHLWPKHDHPVTKRQTGWAIYVKAMSRF